MNAEGGSGQALTQLELWAAQEGVDDQLFIPAACFSVPRVRGQLFCDVFLVMEVLCGLGYARTRYLVCGASFVNNRLIRPSSRCNCTTSCQCPHLGFLP